MLEQELKEIGLSDKQVAVYLCVLQYQKILPAKVADITKINRPTVYSVTKELVAKNLIAEDIAGSTKYLVSLGENSLDNLVKEKEQEIVSIKEKIPVLIGKLKQLPKQGNYSIPKIRFIDESRLKKFLIEESAQWAKSVATRDKTWWGFQDHTLLENYQDWADYFWTTFPKEITMNIFTNKAVTEEKVMSKKSYNKQRHVKYLKNNSEFTATHVIAGDYILMIMTHQRPHYLIEIHDRVMAENSRELFKRLWNSTK